MKAIVQTQTGGPEQLVYADREMPQPGPGQALVKLAATGVNFIDIYQRTGLYKVEMPWIPGLEGAGTVEALGPDTEVEGIAVGSPVAFAAGAGAYADYCLVAAGKLVAVPAKVELPTAAAVMLQGMTAHYLTHSTYSVAPGDIVLVHAAAGGVGLLLIQMAKALGARVIGTVGSDEKIPLAITAGAEEVINYRTQDFVAEVKRITDGRGCDVVYDSVGAATFEGSVNCLKPRGMMVTFGNASGPVPPISPLLLSQQGSIFLTRPTLAHYTATRDELVERASEILTDIEFGRLQVTIGRQYPLADAAQAHRDLESRNTTGKLLLIP